MPLQPHLINQIHIFTLTWSGCTIPKVKRALLGGALHTSMVGSSHWDIIAELPQCFFFPKRIHFLSEFYVADFKCVTGPQAPNKTPGGSSVGTPREIFGKYVLIGSILMIFGDISFEFSRFFQMAKCVYGKHG